ncbi:MAG: cation transporter [Prevotella sp.]|nr:cation transporter [Prevotella sp.]
MKKNVLTMALALMATVAVAKDIKTVVVTTLPQMHCENCENRIKSNLRFEKGIKKIETSVPDQTVTITYDADKTNVENIIKGFDKIDYKARPLKEGEKVVSGEGNQSCE